MPGKSLCTIYQEKCQLWKMSLLLSSPKPERLRKRTLDSWQGLGAFSARWAVLLHFFTFLLNKRGDQGKENSVLKIVSTKENIRHWNYRYVIYEEAGNSNSVRGVSLRTPHPEDLKRTTAHHYMGMKPFVVRKSVTQALEQISYHGYPLMQGSLTLRYGV